MIKTGLLLILAVFLSVQSNGGDTPEDLLESSSVSLLPSWYDQLDSPEAFLSSLNPAHSKPLWELEDFTSDTLDTLAVRLYLLHEQTAIELVQSHIPISFTLLSTDDRRMIDEKTKETDVEADRNKKFMILYLRAFKGIRLTWAEENEAREFLKVFFKISETDQILIGGIKDLGEAIRDGLLHRNTAIGPDLQTKRVLRMDRKYTPIKIIPSLRDQILDALEKRKTTLVPQARPFE